MAKELSSSQKYYPDRAFGCEIPEHLVGKRVRATWVTYQERSLWCCDFSGYENNPQGLKTEIEISDAVIRQQAENSLLVAVVLSQTKMAPEIVEFFRANALRSPNPIRKMAVLFLSDFRRWWYQTVQGGIWPRHTAFLNDYEQAKKWLIREAA
jgi:hypothetical protein